MIMFNVTEIRQNVSKIIAQAIKTREPIVLLQRSKPVAYIVEAGAFEELQAKARRVEQYEKNEMAKETLQRLARLRNEMKLQPDSTPLIRQLREGDARSE
ncbi:type II toxin-antitoxin system Phd/YefM family antitoxin [Desulfallas sp. Bu1-1]|jgi:prevent-host-death family protein|uniref:type II toxin-antitoxin system Phd/YefM family antitoxin n=1 Tax=Desulfallas sp. Bu1-1 TaxID=2787620 RepID=UPI0018A042AD|nr:type II toxin-antitoxin system Phd/YefM family antitoxin [Desulfallas sp. Bu1-1]MBF7082120.1 type II toxin-antitoxin system Phd/YefM family antitoxin [Desulfallas sp. Bu1-1]